jgi:hypothetical protein
MTCFIVWGLIVGALGIQVLHARKANRAEKWLEDTNRVVKSEYVSSPGGGFWKWRVEDAGVFGDGLVYPTSFRGPVHAVTLARRPKVNEGHPRLNGVSP